MIVLYPASVAKALDRRAALIKQRKQNYRLRLNLFSQFFNVYPKRKTRPASLSSLSLSKPVQPPIDSAPFVLFDLFSSDPLSCHIASYPVLDLSQSLLGPYYFYRP